MDSFGLFVQIQKTKREIILWFYDGDSVMVWGVLVLVSLGYLGVFLFVCGGVFYL